MKMHRFFLIVGIVITIITSGCVTTPTQTFPVDQAAEMHQAYSHRFDNLTTSDQAAATIGTILIKTINLPGTVLGVIYTFPTTVVKGEVAVSGNVVNYYNKTHQPTIVASTTP